MHFFIMKLPPLVRLLAQLLISYAYCFFLAKKLPKGIPRLISMLGVFYTLFRIPYYFPSSIFLRGFTSFFFSWISAFKLILFSFNKGDLSLCNTYVDFVAVATFPLKLEPNSPPLLTHSSPLRKGVLVLEISTVIFCFQDVMLGFSALWIIIFCDLCTMPHLKAISLLNRLHRSTSIQVFWGKRWNRISSNIIRETIYDPVNLVMKLYLEDRVAKVVALIVALFVSGVMHEVMLYHMTCGTKPTWEVANFFVLQGVCMSLELAIKRYWVRTLGWSPLHPIISVPMTLGFLLVTSYWLVFLPLWRIAGKGCAW